MVPQKKWIRFDLHMHTSRSDGRNSVREMLISAKKKGLDAVAITEHNISNNFDFKKMSDRYGIYVIPGCELSFLFGHLLILGIDQKLIEEKIKQYKIKEKSTSEIVRKNTVRKLLRYFVDNGALIIAAHPKIPSGIMSLKGNFLAELYQNGLVHGMEIHNGDLKRKLKGRLYNIWHNLAKKFSIKLGIPSYSNSDAHSEDKIGIRFNMVKLDSPEKLLDVLKKGKIEIRHGTKSDL